MVIKVTARSIHELGKRTNQEDSIYPPFSPKPTDGSLFILCDGMGGHAAGEVASQTVCEVMSRYIAEHPRPDGLFDQSDFNAALDAAYDALDAKDTDDEKKMGTTLTFVKFHAGGCFIAHIGDSRIYHVRPSRPEAERILHVTRDHSLVNDLIKLGEMTPEEAKTSRQKNVITRAVQPNQETRTKADCLNITDLQPGDYFYMCSDGMLERAEDLEIARILSLDRTDEEKIKILKGTTEENKDNHSAHLIRILEVLDEVEFAPSAPAEPAPEEPSPEEPSPEEPAPEEPDSAQKRPRWLLPLFLVAALAVCVPLGLRYLKGGHENVKAPVEEPASKENLLSTPEPVFGSITVTSEPSRATIWMDGKNTGKKTPATLEQVKEGQHTVKLVLDKYEDEEGTVSVTPQIPDAVFARNLKQIPVTRPNPSPGPGPGESVERPEQKPGLDSDGAADTHVTQPATNPAPPLDTADKLPFKPITDGTVDDPPTSSTPDTLRNRSGRV